MSDLPRWAKAPVEGAVATAKGWVSPKGELLVSHRGLDAKLAELAPKPKKAKKKKEETSEEE